MRLFILTQYGWGLEWVYVNNYKYWEWDYTLLYIHSHRIWFRFWPAIPVSHNSTDNYTHTNETINLHSLPHYEITENFIYGAAILIGIGGTTMLVTSLSMVADLIGKHSVSISVCMSVCLGSVLCTVYVYIRYELYMVTCYVLYMFTYVMYCICIRTYIHTYIHTYMHTYVHKCSYIHSYVCT